MPARQRGSKSKDKDGSSGKGASEEGSGSVVPGEGEGVSEGAERRRKRGGVSWTPVFKRIGIFFLIILIPALVNYAALNQEARMLLPEGATLYDIGWNQKMMLRCTGQGLPTVILEAPVGQSSDVWALVEPLVAKWTKVCIYDRAGVGFSDGAYRNTSEYANDFSEAATERDRTMPSTVERMADDLHRLVSYASNQPKPVLLVSIDFSTFVSRFYAQVYEHEVAGLLLIDPAFEMLFGSKDEQSSDTGSRTGGSKEDTAPLTWYDYWYKRMVPHAQGVWLSGVIGFNRLSLMVGLMSPVEAPKLTELLPKEVLTRKKHLICKPRHLSSILNEYFFMNHSMQQMKTVFTVKPFPDLPITIATYEKADQANLEPELSKVWLSGQEQLLTRVHPDSKHSILPGSDYLTLYTHPGAVANLIHTMVDRWRKQAKLAA